MSQTIVLKRSALPGKVPDTGSLNLGEIAVNTYDGKIYLKRSNSVESIQSLVVTNSTTTGSITLTQTGSFGELVLAQDANIGGDLYVSNDIITNGDLDILGDITGSNLLVRGNIVAQQLIISSSVTNMTTQFASGSTSFGDTITDTHGFTGSVFVTGSLSVNGSVQASSFIGDGANLTNLPPADLSSATLETIDGNNIPNRSIADIFLQLATAQIIDLDFND
jgi:cytoskeletal protein CcmA (bactofilin family)